MKKVLIVAAILAVSATGYAFEGQYKNNPNYSKDDNGRYTRNDNQYKDTDRDGVINKYDRNDSNPYVTTQPAARQEREPAASNPWARQTEQKSNNPWAR